VVRPVKEASEGVFFPERNAIGQRGRGGGGGPVLSDEVGKGETERDAEVFPRFRTDDVTEDSEGESALFQIGWDQRIEGLKSHGYRDVGVAELNLAERIGGFEAVTAKAGKTVPGLWGAALSFVSFEG
jgi:hypothetical protein